MEHIIVTSQNHKISNEVKEKVASIVKRALDRFDNFIRKVEVRFLDSNGPKGGIDTMCTIKVVHSKPGRLIIKSKGISIFQAAHLASGRARNALSRRLERIKSHR